MSKPNFLATGSLIVFAVLLAVPQCFATTGGSWYPSQLTSIGAGNFTYGRTSDWTSTGYTLNSSATVATDLQAGSWGNSMIMVITSTDQPSFMQWDLPSGTFNAQTVIAYRNTMFPFTTGSPWHLELFDGSAWKPITGVAGAGAPTNGLIAIGNTGIVGTKIRAIYNSLNLTGGSYFMSMGEIVVLPDHLQRVTNSYTASASSIFSATYAALRGIDNELGNHITAANHAWFSRPAAEDPDPWYTLTFDDPTRVDALLLSKWDDAGISVYTNAIVDIYVNGTLGGGWIDGTKVADDVEMVSMSSFGNFNVFKFDNALSGVNTLSLKLQGPGRTSDGGHGLGEIIPLTIPEPTATLLVGIGMLWLLRRRS